MNRAKEDKKPSEPIGKNLKDKKVVSDDDDEEEEDDDDDDEDSMEDEVWSATEGGLEAPSDSEYMSLDEYESDD